MKKIESTSAAQLISELVETSIADIAKKNSLGPEFTKHFEALAQSVKISLFNSKRSSHLYSMAKLLIRLGKKLQKQKLEDFKSDLGIYQRFIRVMVHFDQHEVLKLMLAEQKNVGQYLLSIKPEYKYIPATDLFSYAIARNALNTVHLFHQQLKCKINFSHLATAVKYHAEEVFEYLFKQVELSLDERNILGQQARTLGNITILNQLSARAPEFYFNKLTELLESDAKLEVVEKEILNEVSRAYRFTLNLSEVDTLCSKYLEIIKQKFSSKAELVSQVEARFQQAQAEYRQWGCLVAPYRCPQHLAAVKDKYGHQGTAQNMDSEIKYGRKRVSLLDHLLKSDPTGILTFGQIYEAVSKNLQDTQGGYFGEERGDYDIDEMFGTFMIERYEGMTPYMNAVYENMSDYKDITPLADGYHTLHNGELLTRTLFSAVAGSSLPELEGFFSNHGRCVHSRIRAEISKIHDEIVLMDSKEIRDNPALFYQKIAQVLALTGKATFFYRGTGTLVETYLAYIHHKKGLQCPILKKIQLDCINITLPTSLEEKIFLYYFKFDSLDPAVQKYINESSAEPEMDALLKRFKLGKYEKQTISTEECKLVTLSEQAILDNFLSQNLIEINAKNKEGDTLLTWAIAKGDVELTKKLIATGKFIISEKEIALAKQKPEIMRVLRPTVHLSPSAVYLFMISAQNARWFNFEYLNKWSDQTQLKSRSETIPQDIALAVKVPESSISEIKFYGRYGYSFTTTPGTVSALREFEAKHQQHNPIKDEITKIFTLCQSLESKAITDELIKLGKDIQSIKDSPSGIDFLARLQDVLKKDTSPGSQEKLKPVAEKTAGLLNSLLKLQKNLTNGAFAFSL